jgi:hypothetical protein
MLTLGTDWYLDALFLRRQTQSSISICYLVSKVQAKP